MVPLDGEFQAGNHFPFAEFVLDQLSPRPEITYRTMMGEFILYYRGKIVGGIYDDRFLVKPVKSAISADFSVYRDFFIPTAPK